jgi:hypothetical protein
MVRLRDGKLQIHVIVFTKQSFKKAETVIANYIHVPTEHTKMTEKITGTCDFPLKMWRAREVPKIK